MSKRPALDLFSFLVLFFIILIGFSFLGGLIMMWIWNYAVVAALTIAKPIGYWVAFWLAFFFGLYVKSVNINRREE